MRVIAGSLGGRTFEAPRGHRTHPMSDKMRGALFNVLGDISGLSVLDVFAGSGAISIEAISRGASSAVAIDVDKGAVETMKHSIDTLGINGQIKVIRANTSGWSDNNPDVTFDIVMCDPPYDDLQLSLLGKLSTHVKPDGLFVLSWPGTQQAPALENHRVIEQKDYGDGRLVFYRATAE